MTLKSYFSIEEILADSDDELDLERNEMAVKGGKKKSQAFIKEEPGDIIDLADSMAASKISGKFSCVLLPTLPIFS